MPNIETYKVTDPKAIFFNFVFKGYPIVISGEQRIWNSGSVGQSFPANICTKI